MNLFILASSFLFLLFPSINYTANISIPLELNYWNTVQNEAWNGTTPLSLPLAKGEHYQINLILPDKTRIPLKKSIEKDFENQNHYTFTLETPYILKNHDQFSLEVKNKKKLWPLNSRTTKIQHITNTPELKMISVSKTVTHGGAGIVVVESEELDKLSFLAVMDEKQIPFYPKRFLKDKFYAILFAWYTDHSQEWDKQYVLVMDKFGNTNTIPIDTSAKERKYRQSTIYLPKDYAQQKAKELALAEGDAKKLEGNITEINKVLAKQKSYSRWNETRTTFQKNAKDIITNTMIFSEPALPMKRAITTATYGDRRKYLYQGKQVRQSVHRGLDYASVKNAPIYTLLDGTVVYSDWYGGNGKSVVIDHGFNTYSLYAHNSEILVKEGQKVKAGDQISISGTTGQSTGDHLHLSIFVQGMFIEPKEWTKNSSIDKLFRAPLIEAQEYIENQNNTNVSSKK